MKTSHGEKRTYDEMMNDDEPSTSQVGARGEKQSHEMMNEGASTSQTGRGEKRPHDGDGR